MGAYPSHFLLCVKFFGFCLRKNQYCFRWQFFLYCQAVANEADRLLKTMDDSSVPSQVRGGAFALGCDSNGNGDVNGNGNGNADADATPPRVPTYLQATRTIQLKASDSFCGKGFRGRNPLQLVLSENIRCRLGTQSLGKIDRTIIFTALQQLLPLLFHIHTKQIIP